MLGETAKRMEQLLTSLQQIDLNIKSQQIPNKVILLMGQTKAGKTTLYYYLLGKKLIREENELGVWQMRPEINYFIAHIGNGYDSTTVYPNIPIGSSESGVMVIDMPGFDDSRPHFRLLNIYILLQVLKLTQNVHTCLVIPEQCCHSDALMTEFQKIHEIFNQKVLQEQKFVSFIITKVQHQEIRQQFLNQIQDLIESQLIRHVEDDLSAFKAKNIYQFRNSLPIVEEGRLLKQLIQTENTFYPVIGDPLNILSASYCQEIIGRTNLQQFSDYLMSVIEDIKQLVETLLEIYWHVLLIEYNQVFIPVISLKKGQKHSLAHYVEALASSSSKIPLYEFDKIKLNILARAQWKKQHVLNLLNCFDGAQDASKRQDFLANSLIRFGKNIQRFRRTSHLLDEEYLEKVEHFLVQTSNLIFTMSQIKLLPIADKLKGVTEDTKLIVKIQEISSFWRSNYKQIVASPHFLKFRDLPQLAALGQTAEQTGYQIIKVSIYGEARRSKQIKANWSKTKAKKQDGSHGALQYLQGEIDVHPDRIDQSLNQMQISRYSLKLLKRQYEKLKGSEQIQVVRKLLSKMSQILYWFSFFQEAITFRMATCDENTIIDLFEEGTAYQQISADFTQQILIPYYSKINVSITRLDMCYGYLLNLQNNPKEKWQVELDRLTLLQGLAEGTEEGKLLSRGYKPLELQYITRIMQSFEEYLQQMEKKEKEFSKSPIAPLSGFINQIMER